MTDEQARQVSLRVEQSRVSLGGLARIHQGDFDALGLKPRAPVVVSKDKRAILVHVHGDHLVGKGVVRLKKKDMDRLGAGEGDKVSMAPHRTYAEGMRKATANIGRRLRERGARKQHQKKGGK